MVADCAGQGARRPHYYGTGCQSGQDAGAGRVALAHPAWRHCVPEVDDPFADEGELRSIRLRTRTRRHQQNQCAQPGRIRACRSESGHVRLHSSLTDALCHKDDGGYIKMTQTTVTATGPSHRRSAVGEKNKRRGLTVFFFVAAVLLVAIAASGVSSRSAATA